MPRTEPFAKPESLRRCIRDLIALSALPAAWRTYDMRGIGDSIVAALVPMLDADFVSIALPGRSREPIVRLGRGSPTLSQAGLIRILRRGAATSGGGQEFVIPGVSGAGSLRVMTVPIGFRADATLSAASARATFPTKEERLLLNAGANQAAIALQQWLGESHSRRFTEVVQRTTEFIGIASLSGKVQYVNPAGLERVGLASLAHAVRLKVGDFVSPRHRSLVRHEIWPAVLHTGRWKGELCLQHFASGDEISFLVESFRIDDPGTGEPISLAMVGRDLTEQKASVSMLRVANETLERHVERRTSELADANRRLSAEQHERSQMDLRFQELRNEVFQSARLTAAGQMAAALAHQLNQPLTAVINSVNAVKRLLEGRDDLIVAREVTVEAAEQALRASEIVRGLRQFLARDEMQRQIEELAPMIEESSALALSSIAPLTARVGFVFGEHASRVSVNRVQIQQVLINLVRNACEAMAGQAVREVILATRALANSVIEVAVADIGPGIPREMADQLFLPFVSTKHDGMGMGLFISRSIIEAHGGQLTAEPNPAGGTIFRFTLPSGA